MKTLPLSGTFALVAIAAVIALTAALAGSGKASASETVVDCAPVQVTPEIVWGGLLVVPEIDGNHNRPGTPLCQQARCISNGGQCGGCTNTLSSTEVVYSYTDGTGQRWNLVERVFNRTCHCGYHGVKRIQLYVRA